LLAARPEELGAQATDSLLASQRRVSQVVTGNRPIKGRQTALTPEIKTYIETNWLADAQMADSQMCAMVNARFETHSTRRVLSKWRNMLRMLYRPPLRVQFLTEQQKNHSYQWALGMLALTDAAEAAGRPLMIVFSDESRFCLDSDG
jgi:hypothetical protein